MRTFGFPARFSLSNQHSGWGQQHIYTYTYIHNMYTYTYIHTYTYICIRTFGFPAKFSLSNQHSGWGQQLVSGFKSSRQGILIRRILSSADTRGGCETAPGRRSAGITPP